MTEQPADPTVPTDLGSLEVWVGFITGELEQERLRTAGIRERAGQVFRNAGLFFPLIAGITSLISPGDFAVGARVLLLVFASALLCAVGFAVAADWNVKSDKADRDLLQLIPGVAWGSTTAEALHEVATRYGDDIRSLRDANDGIVQLLRWSHVSFAAAVLLGFMTVLAAVLS
ncbi:Uncharacterised protein [Mycobacteroides abscessus subsp. abscessus]|nr:Uncharacterised protein [Mycobacteroides abscessus subsp. abscessus]